MVLIRTPTPCHASLSHLRPILLHSSDLLLVHVLLQTLVEVLPPLEKQRMANELEPWGELQGRIIEHRLQTVGGDVSSVADFIEVGLEVDVCLDEENVVD
jgi:hypothetical protein